MSTEPPTKDDIPAPAVPLSATSRAAIAGRIVTWILLIGLIGVIAFEGSSRFFYGKSLEAVTQNMRASEQSGTRLSSTQAAGLISGWPSISEKVSEGTAVTEYRWPSLLWDLRLQMRSDLTTGSVGAVTIGNGQTPSQPSGPQVSQQSSRPAFFGVSGKAPALTMGQGGTGILNGSTQQGRLIREIVRQAVFISARDELGLPTRDAVLGEVLPDDSDQVIPRLLAYTSIDDKRQVLINIERDHRDGTMSRIATHQFELPPGGVIEALAAQAEILSAGELVATLKKAGLTGTGHKEVAEGAVAAQINADLDQFELLAQFAAVRALHSEIRESGESPERLAALARGYAHLGALSQHLWSPASKAFAARGLLYAERLKRKAGANPLALWTRGYVRAMSGLHRTALADLEAAASGHRAPAPDWRPAVVAFCRGDTATLAQISGPEGAPALPKFLTLLTFGESPIAEQRRLCAFEMLRVQPECELAFDVAVDRAALRVEQEMSAQTAPRFSATLRRFLKDRAEIPQDVKRLATRPAANLKSEVETQMEIVAALRNAGGVGRDAGEPSLGAMASLIRETSFVNACRLLHVEKFSLKVDPSTTLAAVRPLFIGHRYERFANTYAPEIRKASYFTSPEDKDVLPAARPEMIELSERPKFEASNWDIGKGMTNPQQIKANLDARDHRADGVLTHRDATYFDLARALRFQATESMLQKIAVELREVSPESALGVAAMIRHDWNHLPVAVSEWETKFPHDAGVQCALADRYTQLKQFDKAVRFRKRQIALVPDQSAIRALADLYLKHGDEQLWIETLQTSLKAPSYGLEHEQTHADLGDYYMRRKDWEAARPHAAAAAQSHTSRGLICAAEFYERIGDWVQADKLRRENAERYADLGADLDWYSWCRATGHGDVSAARHLAQNWVDRFRDSTKGSELEKLGLYYVLDGQPAQALEAYTIAARVASENLSWSLHMALLADELGQTQLRDEQLWKIRAEGSHKDDELYEIVSAFQNCLDSASNHVDPQVLDWAIRDRARLGKATDEFYFIGKFLALRGEKDQSREFLQRAATSGAFGRDTSRMAAHALLKAGTPPGERRNSEFDDSTTKQLAALWRATKLRDEGDWESALEKFAEIIATDPDFVDAWVCRSWGYRIRGDFRSAIADLNRALELLPNCARWLAMRGQLQEYEGHYAQAIQDYEQALQIDPRRAMARYNLAYLRAACPNGDFRDGSEARKHAQAVQTGPEIFPDFRLAVLAAADAEAGEFDQAIQHQTEANRVAGISGRGGVFEERLKLYQRKEPYHRRPGWWRF